MKGIISRVSILFCVCLISNPLFGQSYQLSGRSAIGFNFGLFAGTNTTNSIPVNSINTNVSSNGFSGNVFFSHWLKEDLSLQFSVGLLTGSSTVSVSTFSTTEQASTVIPFLLGLNYYIPEPSHSDAIRPFVSGAIGMYVGSEAKNTLISQEVSSESVLGGRVGVGVDFLIGYHFILGANLGYNMMANFANPIGGRNNFDGTDFSLLLSYVF